ncbi:MAG: sulfite exporter TauE/SafE family protein [Candidatus Obscuribacterales bacterium]|nr:sulfite exporter TauE/SafE family protein [Candidatus Obscuribacterales bacterium]
MQAIPALLDIVPIGLVSGLLAGAFGVGGGIIAVPLVRHLLGCSAHVAIGSTLAIILPTAIVGAVNYLKQGKLITRLAMACGAPAVLGTIVASYASHFVEGQHLMLVLAALMFIVGLDFVFGFGNKLKAAAADETAGFQMDRRKTIAASIIGTVVGLCSGLLGIGGGFIMVPSFCYFLGLPLKVAFGTSLLVVAMVALPGTVVHAHHGHVQLSLVLPLLAGSLPGAWLGSYFSLKAKDRILRIVFGSILLVLAIAFANKELNL